jgi:uncharacterized membrane protein
MLSGMDSSDEPTSDRLAESSRVEAFSDGVFAIALTLLVLDLRSDASRGQLPHELLDQWPTYLAYLAAFFNIAAVWINHHDLFTRVRKVDTRLVAVNLVLLLVSSLFPWPASVVAAAIKNGSFSDEVAATVLYAAVGVLVPVAWMMLYRYLERKPTLLLSAADTAYVRAGWRRSTVSLVGYPVAAGIAFVAPLAALVIYIALPGFFIATLLRHDAPEFRAI